MMKFRVLPSFRIDGSIVQLADFLSAIPENGWIWSVVDFEGVGVAPDDLEMVDFENQAKSKPEGFVMTWHELKGFSDSLIQTYHCMVVAADAVADISGDRSEKASFSRCHLIIEAFDSSEWSIWSRDSSLMRNMIALANL